MLGDEEKALKFPHHSIWLLLVELHLEPHELDQCFGALPAHVSLGGAARRPGLEGGHVADLPAELGLLVARDVPQPPRLAVDEKRHRLV